MVLLVGTPSTRVVLVASSLEEMTRCEENQQDYECEQSDRWDDWHAKSWSVGVPLILKTVLLYIRPS